MFETPEIPAFAAYDIDVEQSLLASILVDPSTLPIIASIIEPGDFYDPLHGRIFDKMLVLDELDRIITPVTLYAVMKTDPGIVALKEDRRDVEFVPQDYFRLLLGSGMEHPAAQLPPLAKIVRDLKVRRDAEDALDAARRKLASGSSLETALGQVVAVSDSAALMALERQQSPAIEDAFGTLAREVEQRAQGKIVRGMVTGWTPFDEQLGGFMPESFTVIAGRPGMGKSIMGTSLARIAGTQVDDQGERVYDPSLFSLEMSQKENVARIIAEIDFLRTADQRMRDPRFKSLYYSNILKGIFRSDEEFERFVMIGGELKALGIEIFDEAKMTMSRIAGLARARAQLNPTKRPFIVIDHLQIVGAEKTYRGNRLEELTEITGACKTLAKRIQAPVVALSQLSRSLESREDKRPLLADLRESGSIEQDADAVIFLYRPEYYLRAKQRHAEATNHPKKAEIGIELMNAANRLDVDVAKNRHGSVGDVRLWVDVAAGCILAHAPGSDPEPQGNLLEPLDGLDDLAKRTGSA